MTAAITDISVFWNPQRRTQKGDMMRVIHMLLLILFIGVIAIFCVQNLDTITVEYLEWSVTVPLPLLVLVIYLLGMLSGGAVLSFMRRSIHRVTDEKK